MINFMTSQSRCEGSKTTCREMKSRTKELKITKPESGSWRSPPDDRGKAQSEHGEAPGSCCPGHSGSFSGDDCAPVLAGSFNKENYHFSFAGGHRQYGGNSKDSGKPGFV